MHLLAEAINECLMYRENLRINCINSVENRPLFSSMPFCIFIVIYPPQDKTLEDPATPYSKQKDSNNQVQAAQDARNEALVSRTLRYFPELGRIVKVSKAYHIQHDHPT
jgi:hypothetical protein